MDYDDGAEKGALQCDECGIGAYVTGMCESSHLQQDSGKFHNHCTECKGLGKCIGDYREVHCHSCGKHYFGGFITSNACPCQDGGHDSGEEECVVM